MHDTVHRGRSLTGSGVTTRGPPTPRSSWIPSTILWRVFFLCIFLCKNAHDTPRRTRLEQYFTLEDKLKCFLSPWSRGVYHARSMPICIMHNTTNTLTTRNHPISSLRSLKKYPTPEEKERQDDNALVASNIDQQKNKRQHPLCSSQLAGARAMEKPPAACIREELLNPER